MRIDKFLKNSRLIKRRTIANEACSQGRVSVNGKPAKPGTTVVVGDVIEIRFGEKLTKIRVLSISDHISKANASELYEYLQND